MTDMDFGLIWPFRNPPIGETRRSTVDVYHDSLDEIVAAEEMGYSSAWLTEHHFTEDDYLPSVMPALAAAAVRTSTIRIGTYVLQSPLHEPVRLAEDAAVVDVLSKGRLDLALGVGYREEEFAGLGIDRKTRGRRHDESTQILQRAWQDGPMSFDGKIFTVPEVNVTPKPVQRPIPLWLGGTSRPVLERIARLGVPGVAGRPVREDMDYFLEQLVLHGRDPRQIDYMPFRFIWVDRDHDRARRVAMPFAQWVIGNYQQWFGEAGTTKQVFEGEIERLGIFGSPEYCIDRLGRFLDKGAYAPVKTLILQPPLLGFDHVESMRMMETFASEVMPHFAGLHQTHPA
jgi:alkanesulfonate monooxygenase SsuD/methylene tetrahydromethanopterin reductase-like flavin-dependent oxidoreductase (luciferase family)